MVRDESGNITEEFDRFAFKDNFLDFIVDILGLVCVIFLASFGEEQVNFASTFATCSSKPLDLERVPLALHELRGGKAYHPDGSFIRIVTDGAVDLSDIQSFFTNRSRNKNVVLPFFEFFDKLATRPGLGVCNAI